LILKQKQGGYRKEFEIINDAELRIKEKESGKLKEWTVNLDLIGWDLIYKGATRKRLYILASFFAALLVFMTIGLFISHDDLKGNLTGIIGCYLLFVTFILLILYLPLKKKIYMVGGAVDLTFFQDSPSKEEVDNFISEIIRLSKQILINKYGKIDSDLPEETVMNQFNWLKNRDLITEEEYIDLKKAYKTRQLLKS
jgi:hypothetical protein